MQIEAKNIQYCCFILLEFEHDTQSEMFCVDEKNLFRPEIKIVVFFSFVYVDDGKKILLFLVVEILANGLSAV